MTVERMTESDDLFAVNAEVVVNPVNCYGKDGLGLALRFSEVFPENSALYREFCRNGGLRPGGLFYSSVEPTEAAPSLRFVVNMATKDHWKDESSIEWIARGLRNLHRFAEKFEVQTIAIPAIGGGLGKLPAGEVNRAISEEFEDSSVIVLSFPPKKGPAYGSRWRR